MCGEACTTTTLALGAAWPAVDDLLVFEADPAGGDLAAWMDMPVSPSLSTIVTRVLDGAWPEIERHTRVSRSGLRVVPAPVRRVEAAQAVAESARVLVPALAALRSPVTIVDIGDPPALPAGHPVVGAAAVTVIVHRQATQSAAAAAVRLERLADQVEEFVGATGAVIVTVVGDRPFDTTEISRYVTASAGDVPIVGLPVDGLAAAVLAGRQGVSARRLARLPLLRAARELAAVVGRALDDQVGALWRVAR